MARKSTDSNIPVQLDLFVSDMLNFSPKSDQASLEHPLYSISKRKDIKIRRYDSPDGKVWVEIIPSAKGAATIWDRDVVLFCLSTLRDMVNKGVKLEFNQPVNITSHNLLTATQRGVGGRAYDSLEDALDRLKGTTIKTNIPSAPGETTVDGFGLIEKYKIIRCSATGRMNYIEVMLSDWLWNLAVHGEKDLLTINPDYFLLGGGIERRIYELSRKHCGNQASWNIHIRNLHIKSGSHSTLKEFKRMLLKVVEENDLPDYSLAFADDKLFVYNRAAADVRASLKTVTVS